MWISNSDDQTSPQQVQEVMLAFRLKLRSEVIAFRSVLNLHSRLVNTCFVLIKV